MFKNAVSMMGANEQILAPAAEKLDQFVALGSGGQYANYQEQAQMRPIRQLCLQPERLVEMLPVREVNNCEPESTQRSPAQPGNTIGGITAQSLNENNGRHTLQMKVAQVKVFFLRQIEIL
jgi:conjugal transfer mating pair stabilization protein TraG